ncbi:uclacyanin 1 [Eucalyptus grandis]|uniref:uclacyanin 1 n=1 Tax=Eucalyptus grandis TaxID=71139 RepID=UPI00192EE4E9|nr:uclacyanin 1 [Eucalyptus grandis]
MPTIAGENVIGFSVRHPRHRCACHPLVLATQWTVGDDSGWTNNDYDYNTWAQGKVVRVGDIVSVSELGLEFNYQEGNHNVFKLTNATDFQACNIPPANETLTSGHDVIPLNTPGVKWYICGISQHCAKFNQKLKITVMDAAAGALFLSPLLVFKFYSRKTETVIGRTMPSKLATITSLLPLPGTSGTSAGSGSTTPHSTSGPASVLSARFGDKPSGANAAISSSFKVLAVALVLITV